MPRNGDTGLTATRGRTVPPCRKGPSSHTGRMPTPRLPHPLARRRLTWLRPGKPKPAAPWASAPAAPAAGTGAGPSPRPEPRPAQRRRATRPVPAPPAGPPGTGKRPALRPGNSPAGRAQPLSAAGGRCSPKRRPRPAAGPLPAVRPDASTPTGLPGSRRQKWKSAAAGKSSSPAGKCHCAGTASPAGDRGLNSSAASSASVIPPCRITRPALPAFGPSPAP